MKPLAIAWIVALVATTLVTLSQRGESTCFYGIAETRERVITSESTARVATVQVVAGEPVNPGDTILTLDRTDLDLALAAARSRLTETRLKRAQLGAEHSSEINRLSALDSLELCRIDNKINALALEYRQNIDWAAALNATPLTDSSGSLQQEIGALKRERARLLAPSKAQRSYLSRNEKEDPLVAQQALYENEIAHLEKELAGLVVRSTVAGVITSLRCTEGQQVKPFDSLATVAPLSPPEVSGYIHESIAHSVKVGQLVRVSPIGAPGGETEGRVVSVGSKILSFPPRLRKMPELEVWGREVRIALPRNDLLHGEKVLVDPEFSRVTIAKRIENLLGWRESVALDRSKGGGE